MHDYKHVGGIHFHINGASFWHGGKSQMGNATGVFSIETHVYLTIIPRVLIGYEAAESKRVA